MLHLVRWPEMRSTEHEQLLPVARICALLARGPSAEFLIHRRLDLPQATVQRLLAQLRRDGFIRSSADDGVCTSQDAGPGAGSVAVGAPSIWSHLLQKLCS